MGLGWPAIPLRSEDEISDQAEVAIIAAQKYIDAGDYQSATILSSRAISTFGDNDVLYQLKGEALYKLGQHEDAEIEFRNALSSNPLNDVAKRYIEEIRSTKEAATSAELAEWISIAKDKVGDFIVTFLALFAAFVVNNLIAPITLQLKLNRARRLCERGDYDEFTDLIEGLLDLENFAPIRTNFQFLLRQKSYEEAQEILNKYVNTLDRLPTLLRILEREYERKLEATG